MCKCVCDCGNTSVVYKCNLVRGFTKSCGCLMREHRTRFENLTGQRFGLLTAIMPTQLRKDETIVWHCQCACGQMTLASTKNLKNGRATHCGCLTRSKQSTAIVAGERYGKLTTLRPDGLRNGMYWICQCDCGTICSIRLSNLKSGHTKSCGCLRKEEHRTLVEGTCVELIASTKIPKNNRSGAKGVFFCGKSRKWVAKIVISKKAHYLGQFYTMNDAMVQRALANEKWIAPILDKYGECVKSQADNGDSGLESSSFSRERESRTAAMHLDNPACDNAQ